MMDVPKRPAKWDNMPRCCWIEMQQSPDRKLSDLPECALQWWGIFSYLVDTFLRIQCLIREDVQAWNAPISTTACLYSYGDKSIDTFQWNQWNDTKKQESVLRVPVQNPLPGASSHLHRGALLDWHCEWKVQLLSEPWLQCYQRQSQNIQNVWSSRSWLLL